MRLLLTPLFLLTRDLSPCIPFSPSLRTTSSLPTDYKSVPVGLRILRYAALLLLMMIVGVNTAWGQTVDYSGTYYIGTVNQTDGFYLCPTKDWYYYQSTSPYYTNTADSDPDKVMPFLTTYKCKSTSGYASGEALWVIEKHPSLNYYYIKHASDHKYLTYNAALLSNKGRLRVHLEDTPANDDYALFKIEYYSASQSYDIISKYAEDNNIDLDDQNRPRKYLNINKGNKQDLKGTTADIVDNINVGGIIGLWSVGSAEQQATGRFFLEEYVPRPTITNTSSNIEINHSEEGATIYYTTNGTNPKATNYDGTGTAPLEINIPENAITLKTIATIDGLPSCISSIRVVPNPTISLASSPIIYNGSEQEPAFSVMDGETEIPESEYTVGSYSNNKNAGTASVIITDNAGGNYIVYGSTTFTINPKPLTITANNKTITYGDVPTNDGVTYGEFAGTETSAVLTGTLAYAYNYEQYGDAGSYAITPSGLSNSNYDITFAPGILTVNPKAVTVTSGITASDKTYDGTTDATLDGSSAVIEGKIGSDELTVLVGSGTFADKNVGTDKTVTINSFTFGGAKAGNYQMAASGHQATAQASITPAALTVTAEAQSKTYGDADPEFTYTSEGLISPDAISGLLSRAAGENVGTYAINQGTLTAGTNYSITYTGANLTIEPKSIGDGNNVAAGITINMASTGDLETVKDGETTLVENTDYTYVTETVGNDMVVTITGMGNYTGSAQCLYANVAFMDADGNGSGQAAAVYRAKQDMASPNGVKPYLIWKVNPTIGTISIAPLEYIPEDVPVLLLSDDEAAGFVASPKDDAIPEISNGVKNSNQLKVSQGGETVEAAQIYMFYRGEFVLTKAGTLGQGRYFLYNPNFMSTPGEEQSAPQSRTILQVVVEEPTDIETNISEILPSVSTAGEWYSLDGRRLGSKPTKQGVYIRKGHKTILK